MTRCSSLPSTHARPLTPKVAKEIELLAATICAMAAAWRVGRVPTNLGHLEAGALLQVYTDELCDIMRCIAKPPGADASPSPGENHHGE